MTSLLLAAIGSAIIQFLLAIVAIFLILLVLVQRGRGGGLAGALGGMGGSSAFGAKAGDVFTRITIVAAAVWICLCIIAANVDPGGGGDRLQTTGIGGSIPSGGPALNAPVSEEDDAKDSEGTLSVDEPAAEEPASEQPAEESSTNGKEPAEKTGE